MFGGIATAGSDRIVFAAADGSVLSLETETGRIVGEFAVSRLPPGPLDLEFHDREGRSGRLQALIREGEDRRETVILR